MEYTLDSTSQINIEEVPRRLKNEDLRHKHSFDISFLMTIVFIYAVFLTSHPFSYIRMLYGSLLTFVSYGIFSYFIYRVFAIQEYMMYIFKLVMVAFLLVYVDVLWIVFNV